MDNQAETQSCPATADARDANNWRSVKASLAAFNAGCRWIIKRTGHCLIHLTANMLTLLLLLLALLGGLLGSQSGRLWLLQAAVPQLLATTGYQLITEKPASEHLGQWSLPRIALMQGQQTVFSAENLKFSLKIRSLLNGKVDISTLHADHLQLNIAAINTLTEALADTANNAAASATFDCRETFNCRETLNWQAISSSELVPVRVLTIKVDQVHIHLPGGSVPALAVSGSWQFAWQESLLKTELNVAALEQGFARIQMTGQLSEQFTGHIELSVREEQAGWLANHLGLPSGIPLKGDLRAEISRAARGWQIRFDQLAVPFDQHDLSIQGDVLVDENAGVVSTGQLKVSVNERLQLLSGRISRDSISIDAVLDAFPVGITAFWQEILKDGALSGKIALRGTPANPQAKAALHLDSHYQDLPVDVQAEASLLNTGQNAELILRRFNGRLGELSLAGSGVLNFPAQTITVNSQAINSNSQAMDLNSHTMNLKITQAQAPLSYLRLLGIKPVEKLQLVLKVADVKLTGPFTDPAYAGKATVFGTFKGQGFAAASQLAGDIDGLQFRSFELLSGKSQLLGNGLFNWSRETLDLAFAAKQVPLAMLNLLDVVPPQDVDALVSVEGTVQGSLQMPRFVGGTSATGSYLDQGEPVNFNVSAVVEANPQKLKVIESLAELKFPADSLVPAQDLRSHGKTTLTASGDYLIDEQRVNAMLEFKALPLSVYRMLGLSTPYQVSGELAGDLRLSGSVLQPIVNGNLRGSGSFAKRPFTMELVGGGELQNVVIKSAQLSWGEARFAGKGSFQQGISDFSFTLEDFNLQSLGLFGVPVIPAELDANLSVRGPVEQPDVTGKLLLTHQIADPDGDDGLRLSWQAAMSLFQDELLIQSQFKRNDTQQGLVNMALPWSEYRQWISQSDERQSPGLPLQASIQGQLDLAWLDTLLSRGLLDQGIHDIAGIVDIDLVATGLLGSPVLNGNVCLEQGSYKNQLTLTSLEQAEIDILLTGKRLEIKTGKASDGGSGRLIASGFVDWSRDRPVEEEGNKDQINLSVTTRGMQLLRRNELEGEASGQLSITGDFEQLMVDGDIDVSPLHVMLDILNDSSIPQLDVVESEQTDAVFSGQGASVLPQINLNVVMRTRQQAFIRGRGLNAELEGMARVVGRFGNPDYRGKFAVVRGTFDLFGKRFVLAEGDVLFDNDTVSVYIEGRYTDENYQYRVTISGGMNDLAITLSAQPELPQDEAVSRLLFGKSVQSITAFQAVRLAQAVQTLTGNSSGFDPIASTRDALQLDNLTVDSANTESGSGVSVGVGKYINERVYVELERSADSAQPWQGSIEVELTPRLVLEGSTDDIGGASVDLKWKYDY